MPSGRCGGKEGEMAASPCGSLYPDQTAISVQEPFLYVVTVNYYCRDHLIRLIDSLRGAEIVMKLIIVNHSTQESLEGLEADFPIQIIGQKNRGYGAGLNRGVKEITDDQALVLLCNPDIIILNPKAIREACQYMSEHPKIGALFPALVDYKLRRIRSCRKFYNLRTLCGIQMPWWRKTTPEFLQGHYYQGQGDGSPLEVDWSAGAALFVRSSLFRGFEPLFDERFFLYFEDVDFCARLWLKGHSVVYFPDLIFQHDEQRLSRKSLRFLILYLTSLMRFVFKYRGLPQRADLLNRRSRGTGPPESGCKPIG
jgi:GT2 family glycosyltransferase